ncbi:MAG: hypothetical protein OER43_13695 [Gammaproteobacteria bacterium]|nr:hypothetical protein [Gammaproteobacteria bacterium]MDH3411745.1 hypothetical protein [Gammaproteobacteria bacterium]
MGALSSDAFLHRSKAQGAQSLARPFTQTKGYRIFVCFLLTYAPTARQLKRRRFHLPDSNCEAVASVLTFALPVIGRIRRIQDGK